MFPYVFINRKTKTMKLVDAIKNLIKGGKDNNEVPEDYCPNCWGHQKYAGRK